MELQDKAKRSLAVADHMAHVTFKLFNDPKILLAILENLNIALESSMNALLIHEREKKNIHAFADNFEHRYKIFKDQVAPRHGIEDLHLKLIRDVRGVMQSHKKSPVEFVRNDRFVICNDDYDMKTLSVDQIKQYVIWTKGLLAKVDEALR